VTGTPQFQRARRPEHKDQRREAILAAARDLAGERAVRDVSLGDVARRVGLAKSNLLRYYESREAIFLQLLLREWESWRTDAAERLMSGAATPDAIAAVLASTLARRPLFCDLVSEMASVLERNVSGSTVRAFKAESIDKVDALGSVLTELLPGLDVGQGRETVAAALIITAGLWPIANPAPHVSAMYGDFPELTRAHVDFEPRLRQLLATLITGFLHGGA
jgi:AcrR family transcriptional regulator